MTDEYIKNGKILVNGLDHHDWTSIMNTWENIKSLEDDNNLKIVWLRIGKKSILFEVMVWPAGRMITRTFYHDCKRNKDDCSDMREVYYRIIVDFIEWCVENGVDYN